MHAHQRLVAFRREHDLSLTDLAERISLSPQMLGYLERGEKLPSIEIASDIEAATTTCSSGPIRIADWLTVPLAVRRRRARQTRRRHTTRRAA